MAHYADIFEVSKEQLAEKISSVDENAIEEDLTNAEVIENLFDSLEQDELKATMACLLNAAQIPFSSDFREVAEEIENTTEGDE